MTADDLFLPQVLITKASPDSSGDAFVFNV